MYFGQASHLFSEKNTLSLLLCGLEISFSLMWYPTFGKRVEHNIRGYITVLGVSKCIVQVQPLQYGDTTYYVL